jgi:hypothetical protein
MVKPSEIPTLGWIESDPEKMQEKTTALANNFLELEPLIDQTLAKFKV